MKTVAFNGSPNKNGNTFHALQMVLDVLAQEGIETEMVHVGNKAIRGCLACGQCIKHRNERCIQDDEVNEWIQKMKTADGILLGSPVLRLHGDYLAIVTLGFGEVIRVLANNLDKH